MGESISTERSYWSFSEKETSGYDSDCTDRDGERGADRHHSLKIERKILKELVVRKLGLEGKGRRPLNVLVLGMPGVGKSSVINTMITALSGDRYKEYAWTGSFYSSAQMTYLPKRCHKEMYMKPNKSDICFPTFIDTPGFMDEDTEFNAEVMRILFSGDPAFESLKDAEEYYKCYGLHGLRKKYFQSSDLLKVDRILIIAAANEPIPKDLIKCITRAANPNIPDVKEQKKIPVFGIMTKVDRVDVKSTEFREREAEFIACMGLKNRRHRYMRLINYCSEIDKEDKRLDYSLPELDVPALKLLLEVFEPMYGEEKKVIPVSRIKPYRKWDTLSLLVLPFFTVLLYICVGSEKATHPIESLFFYAMAGGVVIATYKILKSAYEIEKQHRGNDGVHLKITTAQREEKGEQEMKEYDIKAQTDCKTTQTEDEHETSTDTCKHISGAAAPSDESKRDGNTYKQFEDISIDHAVKHGNIRLLQALTESGGDMSRSECFPLHTAVSLGLKRTALYLLQSGEGIDTLDNNGESFLQCAARCENKAFYKYFRTIGGYEEKAESLVSAKISTDDNALINNEDILKINMERVDLSTRTIYFPSMQFRTTAVDNPRKLWFTTSFCTTYESLCQINGFGILYTLSKYWDRGLTKCVTDVCLPDRMSADQGSSCAREQKSTDGKLDPLPNWIDAILSKRIENVKEELQRGIQCENDGWTPLHYAILTRQANLIEYLLKVRNEEATQKTRFLLPYFILSSLEKCSPFEYHYVYKHMSGFSPLMLATFLEFEEAIDLLGQVALDRQDVEDFADCLSLAYGENTENHLLHVLCSIGEAHVKEKFGHITDVKLQPGYKKENPMKRVLSGSSEHAYCRIETDFFPVQIIIDNKNIQKEYLRPPEHGIEVSAEEVQILTTAIEENAATLWNRYVGLNAIMPGHRSSLPDSYPTTCDTNVMIVLHVSDKELIPVDEPPLPKYLESLNSHVMVYIIEGSFRHGPRKELKEETVYSKENFKSQETVCSKENSKSQETVYSKEKLKLQEKVYSKEKLKLQVGCPIDVYEAGSKSEGYTGTLGVFVTDSNGQESILTCAHTFLMGDLSNENAELPDEILTDSQGDNDIFFNKERCGLQLNKLAESVDATVDGTDEGNETSPWEEFGGKMECESTPSNRLEKCGFVKRVIFQPDRKVSIDAALIMLDKDLIQFDPCIKTENRALDKSRLKKLGFQGRNDFRFSDGEKCCDGEICVKYGDTTNITAGNLGLNTAGQVKFYDGPEELRVSKDSKGFIMKGQFVVTGLRDYGVFFQNGDSGSAVFVKEEKDNKTVMRCLGIAIGYLDSSFETLVTPIQDILEALVHDSKPNITYNLKSF